MDAVYSNCTGTNLFWLFDWDIFTMLSRYVFTDLPWMFFGYFDWDLMAICFWHFDTMFFGNLFRYIMTNFLRHRVAMFFGNFMGNFYWYFMAFVDRFLVTFVIFMISISMLYTMFLRNE